MSTEAALPAGGEGHRRARGHAGSADPFPHSGPPLRVEHDPFCVPPPDISSAEPGTVIRSRSVRVAWFGRIPQRVQAWQLLFRTADRHGAAEAALTTVLLPHGADPARPRPLVSFQCAIDAVASSCFPSYALRHGARVIGAIPQLEYPLIAHALARGWAVSVPDHEGMRGHFGAGREPGYRTLDGIRAALSFAPLGLSEDTPVGLWGYSGGGLATAWAAEVAAGYAPEIDLVGAVAGSPVGDPAAAFVRLNATAYAGFAAVYTAGLRRSYPELAPMLADRLYPRYLRLLVEAESRTTFALLARFAGRSIDRNSHGGIAELVQLPQLRTIFDDIRPGATAPEIPMLILQAIPDEVIAVADVDALVARYRAAGAEVHYLRDRLALHLPLEFLGAPTMADWLADRFAGLPRSAPVTTDVWSVAGNRRSARDLCRFAGQIVRMLTARPIAHQH
ncbi:lipase family protein [Nocardia cyriacigeorgica]|uniref:lipase family protein n=1 Tax=Nocardia cyriacigeorgica TaxID=135487 RepID=UPI001892FFB6|nr:lipase family protein [Nocardia cyriacigeorgica]MBF6451999.1 lipase [Nocardia cyriacigeorgica]MBF6478018.1 lipase [Nocardia cyriacigeorgica]MBF6549168.1 lipase [Nocardia cyriacigeorgica]